MSKQKDKKNIYVTQPAVPPLKEYLKYLKKIWESKILSNNGPFHQQFEEELAKYLKIKYISLFSNGTLALITALQALDLRGEVITTPFSFVATTHSLLWNHIKPVFVDIDPKTFNIDPEKIEKAITSKTSAIFPVHVYGNPCNVKRIKEIAKKYNLKVIYDACHTFGVTINNVPVLDFGDLSVMSFHATKVFNTFEGGAIVCHDRKMKEYIDHLKNFGITSETQVETIGLNAKMNEVQAAMGLLQLKYVDDYIAKRKIITELYRKQLKGIKGIAFLNDFPGVKHCYSYFPILVDKDKFGITRDELYNKLKQHNIFSRRYFYPLISQFPIYSGLESAQLGRMPVAERVTEQVLCLPLYSDLSRGEVTKIVRYIKESHN
ncbi:MAG: DegT/DnrJ/EryC1/StrS family aminotransferase [Candidatus Pacebacteria bacterium]|nr:DegT/DnrJ/EryC1/StrS family aminotransferase [Candidatus Paceibacterota bacterium]